MSEQRSMAIAGHHIGNDRQLSLDNFRKCVRFFLILNRSHGRKNDLFFVRVQGKVV